jgi:hypothetical protein
MKTFTESEIDKIEYYYRRTCAVREIWRNLRAIDRNNRRKCPDGYVMPQNLKKIETKYYQKWNEYIGVCQKIMKEKEAIVSVTI